MKLLACIKKDILLVCGSPAKALLCIVLPIALLFLLTVFMSGSADVSTNTEKFPIAVRDNDDTVMSKLVITNLRNIPLFGEVRTYDEDDAVTDDELIASGCAAVITVPKDFFYDLYDMKPTDVRMTLNGDMPREAEIVRAAVGSISSIIRQNQSVYYAAARIRYGDLEQAELDGLYHDYSDSAVNAALNRLNYFEIGELYADEEQNQKLFIAAGLCSMLIMFIPLCVLRSLYEEKELGIIARLRSAGGGVMQAVLSKFLAALVMTALPTAAVLIIIRPPNAAALIPALAVTFIASFVFYLVISLLFRSSERAQLAGNVIMLLMLIVGGALFPFRLLPAGLQKLSPAALPYYVSRSFYAASLGRSAGAVLRQLTPVAAAIPALAVLAVLLYTEPWRLFGRRGA